MTDMRKSMRHCATCRFAAVTEEPVTVKLQNGAPIYLGGGKNFLCKRPGGAGNITVNHNRGWFDCTRYERKTGIPVVAAWCEECESGTELLWDVTAQGYKAFCPECGARLMLCDECQHRGSDGEYTDDCNYDRNTDSCRFNPPKGDKADRVTQKRTDISRKAEFEWLSGFANESCFSQEPASDQLRSLWTAYCLHHNLMVDTSGYDNDLLRLWECVRAENSGETDTADWSDYESFDNFMCRYLV